MPGVHWFSTDHVGVGPPDRGHYNAQGQLALGRLFAQPLLGQPEVSRLSYTYNNADELTLIHGKDLDGAAETQALVDGLGKAGDYTPTSNFWAPGQEGTVYLDTHSDIRSGQPQRVSRSISAGSSHCQR